MKETLVKAGLSAGIAGIASALLFPSSQVNAFGMSTSSTVITAAAVGVGSVASDLIAENLIDGLNIPQNIKSTEEFLVRSGLCGVASTGVLLYAGVPLGNAPTAFLLGAGSKMGGDYAEEKFFGKQGMMMQLF